MGRCFMRKVVGVYSAAISAEVVLLLVFGNLAFAGPSEFRVLRTYVGSDAAMCLGTFVTRTDDVDGDAIADFAIGAPNRCPVGQFADWGSVKIVSGSTGQPIREIPGPEGATEFGTAIVTGDFTGDGVPEVLVGAPGSSRNGVSGAGSIFCQSSGTGESIYEISAGTPIGATIGGRFGASLALFDDFNTDGIADFAVGAPNSPNGSNVSVGKVFLVSGASGAVTDSIVGSVAGEGFGACLAPIGDWNLDGDMDIAIGSPSFQTGSGFGRVLIFDPAHGSPVDTILARPQDSGFGATIVLVGDIDNDGYPELAVGAPGLASGEVGHVYIFSRNQVAPSAIFTGQASEGFGSSFTSVDIDGDGTNDLMVGANGFTSSEGFHSGRVYLFPSFAGAGTPVAFGSNAFSELGSSLATVTDVNGDGREDVLIGAPGTTDESGSAVGAAYVLAHVETALGRGLVRTPPLRIGQSHADTPIQIEPINDDFNLGELSPTTLTLSLVQSPLKQVRCNGIAPVGSMDSDGNGVFEATAMFSATDISELFESYGTGSFIVQGRVEGDLSSGRRLVADIALPVEIAPTMRALVSPNPNHGKGVIGFKSSTPGAIRCELFDATGRVVGVWNSSGVVGPGWQRIDLETALAKRNGLSSGVYFYRISVGASQAVGRWVLVR